MSVCLSLSQNNVMLISPYTYTENNNMNKRIIIITFIMMMAKLYTCHRDIHSEGRVQ